MSSSSSATHEMENNAHSDGYPIVEDAVLADEEKMHEKKIDETAASSFPFPVELSKTTRLILVFFIATAIVCIVTALGAGHATGRLPLAVKLTVKPRADTRSYQFATLRNGIRVVNVQDNGTKQRAFAVAVTAGSFQDPTQFPGLAHLCEHMLFAGTRKYPDPDGFNNFLAVHGGTKTAYTAYETTVFSGEMFAGADGVEGQDRFADSFRSPSFDPESLEAVINSIDSEHAKNKKDPRWSTMQLLYSLSNPASVLGKFHTGNAHTLSRQPQSDGVDPRAALGSFFNSHYCANRMHVVTFSSEPLEEQLRTAERQFGKIGARDRACQTPVLLAQMHADNVPFPDGSMGKYVTALGTQPQAQLWMHFHLPSTQMDFMSQPLQYLFWVLEYGGEGSLSRVLKDHVGLATDFSVVNDQSSQGTELFIVLSLTELGRSHTDLAMNVVYAYLAALRRNGVDKKLYQSLERMTQLEWDWSGRTDAAMTAQTLAERMTRLPVDDLLSGDSLISRPNASAVSRLIHCLAPSNMNVAYLAPVGTDETAVFGDLEMVELQHYGVKHAIADLEDTFPGITSRWNGWLELMATGEELSDELYVEVAKVVDIYTIEGDIMPVVPGAIVGVPMNVALKNMHANLIGDDENVEMTLFGERPKELDMTLTLRDFIAIFSNSRPDEPVTLPIAEHAVFYRQGWVATSPKVSIRLLLRPLRQEDDNPFEAAHAVRFLLYNKLLAAELAPRMENLTSAGASFAIDADSEGLTFAITGFVPIVEKATERLLAEFNDYNKCRVETTDARFRNELTNLQEMLQTASAMPYTYAVADRDLLLQERQFSPEELLNVVEGTSKKSVQSTAIDLLFDKPLQLTGLVMGNIGSEDARVSVTQFLTGIEAGSEVDPDLHPDSEVEHVAPIVKLSTPVELRMRNPLANDENHVTVVSIIAGVATIESMVELGIIHQLLQSVAFSELHTRRQLGYVVSAGVGMLSNVHYVHCIVQGTALDPDRTEAAIENMFSGNVTRLLQSLTDDAFRTLKESFKQSLIQAPLSEVDETEHFFSPMKFGAHCIELRNEMLKYLDATTKKSRLLKTWTSLMHPQARHRNRIVVKYFAGDDVPARPTLLQASNMWETAGVTSSHAVLLAAEFQTTSVHDRATSEVRAMLAEEGGHYPTEVHCSTTPSKSQSEAHVEKKPVVELRANTDEALEAPDPELMTNEGTEPLEPEIGTSEEPQVQSHKTAHRQKRPSASFLGLS